MHPRNAACTDELFTQLLLCNLPRQISFNSIGLVEQKDQEPWALLETYPLGS